MTFENVKEVRSALDVMCKYCEQGLCDICPDRETLRKVKEAYENNKKVFNYTRPNYCGIEGIGYIDHGEWADPEIEYKGELFNEYIITDPMYDRFYADFPEKDGDYDEFEKYVYEHRDEVYELLEYELFKIRSDENEKNTKRN